MPTSLDSARPGTAAVAAHRPRRALVALGLAAALTGGTFVATAPHASAATTATTVQTATTKTKPHTVFAASKHTMVKNSGKHRPSYSMKATKAGKAISGRAKLVVNGKVSSTKRLKAGKATFKPVWEQYRVGKNRVRIVVDPTSTTLATKASRTISVTAKNPGTRGQKIVRIAKAQVGDRYSYGSSGPNSFDCSGLTRYVYKKATGKSLPRSSSAQKASGKVVSRKNARPGDIIWTPGHVSIYIGKGQQVEAARPGVGVVKRHIWQDSPRFIRI
ncbi:C40 family peptidase [Isoptericola sp. NPDC055881]